MTCKEQLTSCVPMKMENEKQKSNKQRTGKEREARDCVCCSSSLKRLLLSVFTGVQMKFHPSIKRFARG